MTTLKAENLQGTHDYLADARPAWEMAMSEIVNLGGPWDCDTCGRGSLLCYRCSRCGAPM